MENPPPETEPAEQVQAGVLPAGRAIHAGFWRRWAAWVVDLPILLLLIYLPVKVAGSVRDWDVAFVTMVVAPVLYFALLESSPWQATLGKRIVGIKVVDGYGRRIGFWRAAVRFALPWGILLAFAIVMPSDSGGEVVLIAFLGLVFITCAISGWTARKQTLIDKLAGTFVVFNAVQPGQPWPAEPPPLLWYRSVINIISCLALLALMGVGLTIIGTDSNPMSNRMRVSEVFAVTYPVKEEVNNEGCHPGSRPPPSEKIAAIEVSDAGAGRCTITITLGKIPGGAKVLKGGKIGLTRSEEGQWTCASDLPNKYLPAECRLNYLATKSP